MNCFVCIHINANRTTIEIIRNSFGLIWNWCSPWSYLAACNLKLIGVNALWLCVVILVKGCIGVLTKQSSNTHTTKVNVPRHKMKINPYKLYEVWHEEMSKRVKKIINYFAPGPIHFGIKSKQIEPVTFFIHHSWNSFSN